MVDLTVVPADVQQGAKPKGQKAIAGVAIDAGDNIYIDSDRLAQLSDASALATAKVDGTAYNSVAAGQELLYTNSDEDFDPGAVVVPGTTYVLSATTPGGTGVDADITVGLYKTIIGVATATDKLPRNIINNTGVAHA